ncbi:MAG: hypothetical protein V1739_09110 [Candidatus Omnitrophota bacterium]
MSKKLLYVLACLLFVFYTAAGYCQESPQDTNHLEDNGALNALQSKHLIYKSKMEKEKIGLIESITNGQVIINLGKNFYVTQDMEFKVFRREKRIELLEESESILIGEHYIATLKVTEVNEKKAQCRIIHFEPTDYIMVTDKVVSVPGTGYEEILKQREADKKALGSFLEAKKASRNSQEAAIELYKKVLIEFPQSTYAQVAKEELDRYKRITDNSPYEFKRMQSFRLEKSDASSLSKDIAIDSNGDIWLLNSQKILLEKYSMSGELLITVERKNKHDLEIMRTPTNLTIDADDNIYVLDSGLQKASKFDKNGNFINDYGSQESQKPLVKPIDIAVSTNQDVFILDAGISNVIAFNKDNEFWASFGNFDISNTQIPDPIAIATDEYDNIYVLDQGTKYLHTFSSDLRIRKRELISNIFEPTDMVVAFNKAYILDAQLCSAVEYDLALGKIKQSYGVRGSGQGKLSDPTGIAIDSEANIYIADGANFNFQKFSPVTEFIFKLKNSQITKVSSFAVNDSDNLYILDARSGEYQEFDKFGRVLKQVSLKSEFKAPSKVVIDFEANAYVLDSKTFKVHKFSQNGEIITTFGSKTMFKSPIDICVDSQSNIYILEDKEYTVKKFDSKGNHLMSFGQKLIKKRKQIKGQFKKPKHIAINSKGEVFVLDVNLKEVFKFNSETGELISSFKKADKDFLDPVDIAVDGLGYIYIADANDSNIYKFQDNGTLVGTVISTDLIKVQIKPISAISVNGSGSVYALDSATDQVFEFQQ